MIVRKKGVIGRSKEAGLVGAAGDEVDLSYRREERRERKVGNLLHKTVDEQ